MGLQSVQSGRRHWWKPEGFKGLEKKLVLSHSSVFQKPQRYVWRWQHHLEWQTTTLQFPEHWGCTDIFLELEAWNWGAKVFLIYNSFSHPEVAPLTLSEAEESSSWARRWLLKRPESPLSLGTRALEQQKVLCNLSNALMSRFRLQVECRCIVYISIWKDTWLIIPALTVEQQCTVFFAFSDCWREIFLSSNSIVHVIPEMSFWSQDVHVVPFVITSWPGECCRRRSLYGRQLSKRRSATYTRLYTGTALIYVSSLKSGIPYFPKSSMPPQIKIFTGGYAKEDKRRTKILVFCFGDRNIDFLFWWWILPQRSTAADAK